MTPFCFQNLPIQNVLHYFEEICAIPRMSGKEEKIADYLCNFANKHHLSYHRDSMNNVLIRKPHSTGYEHSPVVMLQGHTDMVCEKLFSSEHNFDSDPIHLIFDGDEIHADGTTLGADNGIAVALILAVLEDKTLQHPDIEALFTSSEEIGLLGADAFDYSLCHADILINLDSEEEGYGCVGCSGGMRTDIRMPISKAAAPEESQSFTVHISGLMGGHSGTDIHLGRQNASKLLGKILYRFNRIEPLQLISVKGGSKDNAISIESSADFISKADIQTLNKALCDFRSELDEELVDCDRNLSIRLLPASIPSQCIDSSDSKKLISLLNLCPQGVLKRNPDIPEFIESSVNFGVLYMQDNDAVLGFSLRSPRESLMHDTAEKLHILADVFGAKTQDFAFYPGWDYEKNSQIEKVYCDAYRELYGTDPHIYTIHAGLECGILKARIPPISAISIGPTLKNVHTPSESLNVPSLQKIWDTLVLMLKKLH